MNLASKTGGIFSRFLSTKKSSSKSGVSKTRKSQEFYAFVSTKKVKEGEEVSPEIKFRLGKNFTENHLAGMVGVIDIEEPILFLYPEGCGLPEELFKKRKKAEGEDKEAVATVFGYTPLVKVLKQSNLLPSDYGKVEDENVALSLTDITETYLSELSENDVADLPKSIKIFMIGAESDSVVESNPVVAETKSVEHTDSLLEDEDDKEDELAIVSEDDEADMFN